MDDPVELGDYNEFHAQFELLWEQYDSCFVGFVYLDSVDWDETWSEYEARVDTVSSQAFFIELMAEMLAPLQDCSVTLSFGGDWVFPWLPDVDANYDWDVLWSNYLEPAGFEWFQEDWWGWCVADSVPVIVITEWNDQIYGGYLDEIISTFPDAPAFVIDVRPAGGGVDTRIGQVARRFNDQPRIGYLTVQRSGPGHDELSDPEPRWIYTLANWFDGSVAVLCGETCAGPSELFVCMASELPNTTLIGDTTMAQSNTAASFSLPGSNYYTVPTTTTLRADTSTWVQVSGVPPDIYVEATGEDFAAGIDPVLEYALEWAGSR